MYKKYCFVPNCLNDSRQNPHKLFFSVPQNPEKKKKWYNSVGIPDNKIPKSSNKYCCEDHFDLENDTRNWMEHNTIGTRLSFKSDVVPHLFPGCRKPVSLLPDTDRKPENKFLDKCVQVNVTKKSVGVTVREYYFLLGKPISNQTISLE